VAAMAQIELPMGKWQNLISMLSQNASHDNQDVRKASIITLGYICDEVDG
jgi:hypothetical protein